MAESLKEKVSDAGHAIGEAAKSAGQSIAKGAKQAKDWVADKTGLGDSKETCDATVCERMDVIASCGTKVGVVDHVEGQAIKLTRNDSADGQHHYIPKDWVDHVDGSVHLKKNSVETEQGWKSDAASCGCGS